MRKPFICTAGTDLTCCFSFVVYVQSSKASFADVPNAEQIVLGDARKRVRAGIAHIAAAAVYPEQLRTTSTAKILNVLAGAQLHYCIITETSEGDEWFEGNPAALMEALRRGARSTEPR